MNNSQFYLLVNINKLSMKERVKPIVSQLLLKVGLAALLFFLTPGLLFPESLTSDEHHVMKTGENNAVQQNRTITGRVVDKNGFALIGVTVTLKNRPGAGVATDANGAYSINCNANDVLVFSYVGYIAQELIAGNVDKMAIVLEEDIQMLDELQVVAFGKQKKESVISSITTISPKELRAPSSNVTTAFAGRMAGIIAYQRSGEPGLDNAEFFIRGITTFSASGKRDPLILIDGIEMSSTELARLNVDDIESFSIMKDASAAALYGARGANGVILVTTKEGKDEKLSVNIRAEISSSANSELVELADPITYMTLHNEAVRTRRADVELPYSLAKIRGTTLGKDPIMYPSVNWYDYLIKDRTFNQRVNMNLTGGGKAVQYYLAANYQHDTGILKESAENQFNNNININRLQVRSNVTINLTPNTEAVVRAYGSFDNTTGPIQGGAQVFSMARNASPVRFLPYYPADEAHREVKHILFGASEQAGVYVNPLAQVISGYKDSSSSIMLLQLELQHNFDKIVKGLFVKGTYNVKRDSYYDMRRRYRPFYYAPLATTDGSYRLINFNPDSGTEYLNFEDGGKTIVSSMYGEMRVGYNRTFDDLHDINAVLVGSLRHEVNTYGVNTLQESLPLRNISSAGRLAYGYDSRYFLELNFGYNGSERFSKNHRFGFFPSVGAGWLVSNESFMSGVSDIITNLKLKATYGLVGNDQIGSRKDRFFYMSQIDMDGRGYVFGTDRNYSRTGVAINRYANDLITWEIAKKTNLGIELGLFNDLTILADYFRERRENILQTRYDIPNTMGLVTIPQANVGIAQGHGAEVELKYQKQFTNDMWLIVNGNFTYATSKYVQFEEPDYTDTPWRSYIGKKINQPYGLIADRFFIDEEDVNNSPKQMFGPYGAGDIKYLDINGDGQINIEDQVPIGFPTVPEIIYGTGFSFGFKNFDLSCFFQGSARSSFFISPAQISPFINKGQRALLKYIADDHWSESNRNLQAFWPRLSETSIENNNQTSTHWLRNGAFLRFKTAEVGYTLPSKLTSKMNINMLRIYASGNNLFVWSKFKMWDPEMAGNGLGYPVQRVLNLGVNLTF